MWQHHSVYLSNDHEYYVDEVDFINDIIHGNCIIICKHFRTSIHNNGKLLYGKPFYTSQ